MTYIRKVVNRCQNAKQTARSILAWLPIVRGVPERSVFSMFLESLLGPFSLSEILSLGGTPTKEPLVPI